MSVKGRRLSIDWGHLVVLALIAGATLWYILDARAVSTDTNNLLLIQPLSIAALILCAVIVPQCFRYDDDMRADEEPVTSKEVKASDLMQPKLPTEKVEVIKMLTFAALLGVFVFSLQVVGFDVAMFVFCVIGMAICGERRPLPLILFPLIVTLVVIYGFRALMPYPMITTIL
jgi:hypothetical protein